MESQFETEKHYMMSMVEELVRNLLQIKSRKDTVKRNYVNEISSIEDRYDKDKSYLDLRCQQEMQINHDAN